MEDKKVNVRIILAATWIAAMFGYIYGDLLGNYIPGWIDKIRAGDVPLGSDISLLAAAMLMSIPGFMVILSLTLPYKATRWANIIVGIVHIGIMSGSFLVGELDIYYVYLGIVEMGFNALAIWYAWKWV